MTMLEVRDLEVRFVTRKATIHAVNRISFDLDAGQTLGIVGESGSGKTVSVLAMLGILPRSAASVAGEVWLDGRDLRKLSGAQMRDVRGNDIAMIFQDPMTSLNPVLTIGRQLTEVLQRHLDLSKQDARHEAVHLLDRVGIPDARNRLGDFPHQFSGGMRQRAMIAMAISCRPRVLIADEPTTALDVTIQAQILDLLRSLVQEEGTSLILITHDLGVVAGICERTIVMYAGRFIEAAPTNELFPHPKHPYTVGLLKSVPRLDTAGTRALEPITGAPPDLRELPNRCAFAPRCGYATERSWSQVPQLEPVGATGHLVACHTPVPEDDLVAAGLRPRDQQEPGTTV